MIQEKQLATFCQATTGILNKVNTVVLIIMTAALSSLAVAPLLGPGY